MWFRAAALGVAQGLTEFIPVSSSAHLVLIPFLARWPIPSLAFDVSVHLGTALAVIVYFARDLGGILWGSVRWAGGRRSDETTAQARLLGLLVVASIPAGIAGILLSDVFEDLFATTERVDDVGAPIVASFLFGTAAILLAAERVYARRRGRRREVGEITLIDAIVIGLLQAVAIAPGISRSGSTIGAGMFRGLSREAAARFSFLLSLPAIAGAGLVALHDLPSEFDMGELVVGAVVAAITGFAAIAFLMRYLRTRPMRPFAVYCIALGAVGLAFWSQIR